MLAPSKKVPSLVIDTLAHGTFDLSRDHGPNGSLIIFYRGLHCPLCIKQMTELDQKLDLFEDQGVQVMMLSADPKEKAAEIAEKAGVSRLRVGYGLDLKAARDDWKLLISAARPDSAEPPLFSEPGHFYVAEDQTLYFGWMQTSPFGRIAPEDMARGVTFRLEHNYPPRGMHFGDLS